MVMSTRTDSGDVAWTFPESLEQPKTGGRRGAYWATPCGNNVLMDRPVGLSGAATAAVAVFGAGVGLGIYKSQGEARKKMLPTEQVRTWQRNVPSGFNPTRHAAKALAAGTVLCVSVSGIAAFAVGKAMGVNSVYEFADAVKRWAPAKRRQLEQWLNIKPNLALEEERQKLASMSYDQEMSYWVKVVEVHSHMQPPK